MRMDAEARRAKITPDLISGDYTHSQIAARHKVNIRFVQQVSAELRPAITRTKEEARESGLQRLRSAVDRACDTVGDLLASQDERTRLAAAQTILDRTGLVRSEGRELEASEGAVELSRLVTRSLEITAAVRRGDPRPAELGAGTNDHAGEGPGREAPAGAEEDGDVE
jgi:hypothetical protein